MNVKEDLSPDYLRGCLSVYVIHAYSMMVSWFCLDIQTDLCIFNFNTITKVFVVVTVLVSKTGASGPLGRETVTKPHICSFSSFFYVAVTCRRERFLYLYFLQGLQISLKRLVLQKFSWRP